MRVLLLNDTSLVSGAERCLLDLLAAIAGRDSHAGVAATGAGGDAIEPLVACPPGALADAIEPLVACPPGALADAIEPLVACPPGPLADAVRALGIEVVAIGGTSGSLRLHPFHTPRAIAELSAAALAVRRVAARRGVDLIHANTLRSGLVAAGARRLGGPPFAAFVHDALGDGRPQAAVSRAIRSSASVLFANSAYSAERFGIAPGDPRRRVVFNPIDLAAFDPARHDRAAARERLGLASEDLALAVIGQITPWKGQRDALEILAALRPAHPGARLLIVGEAKFVARATRYDNRAYLAELRALARDRELPVDWLGERDDVPAILAAIDVVLVPSREEPFGRIVIEAMAMGCLVVATARGGPAEIIAAGVDGLLLEPGTPARWAQAIDAILGDPAEAGAIRRAAPATAARFGRETFARAVLEGWRAEIRSVARSRP